MLTYLIISIAILFLPLLSNFWFTSSFTLLIMTFMALTTIYSPLLGTTNVFYLLQLDTMSALLITLTFWISALMLFSSQSLFLMKKNSIKFSFMVLMLNLILISTFYVNNLLLFYVLFESSLVPTLLLILGWGYQPERMQAGMYLMLYTITASLPLLVSILLVYTLSNHLSMFYPFWRYPSLTYTLSQLWWFMSIMAFMVKMPLYITHLWLPKAHVEAPVAGSMILAGILLKLGGYGLLRMISIFQFINFSLSSLMMSLSLWGAAITSMICARQTDIKSLIAYSSVGHMGLLISGAMSCSLWGFQGALLMMIAHGLCSSGMFAIANMTYEATQTRSMFITKGLINLFPTMALLWFTYTCANMAAPPSINLLSEIMLIASSSSISHLYMLPIGLISFLAAAYSLILFTSTQHGSPNHAMNPNNYLVSRNLTISLLHLLPIFILIASPNYLIL
nr:NADH dehydrogenase subunit 4 [Arichlidon gathofi]